MKICIIFIYMYVMFLIKTFKNRVVQNEAFSLQSVAASTDVDKATSVVN